MLGSQLQGVEAGCSWGCHMFTWQDREAHMEESKTETERARGEKNDGKTEAKTGRESLPALGPPISRSPWPFGVGLPTLAGRLPTGAWDYAGPTGLA